MSNKAESVVYAHPSDYRKLMKNPELKEVVKQGLVKIVKDKNLKPGKMIATGDLGLWLANQETSL